MLCSLTIDLYGARFVLVGVNTYILNSFEASIGYPSLVIALMFALRFAWMFSFEPSIVSAYCWTKVILFHFAKKDLCLWVKSS